MRVGNLAPRSYDGEFQVNFNSNSYMGRLKVFYTLGCCSYDIYDELTEMSPIDQTAKAVVLLATTPKECTMFQPFNNHTELLGDVLQLMKKVGREIRFVENDEFGNALAEAGKIPKRRNCSLLCLPIRIWLTGKSLPLYNATTATPVPCSIASASIGVTRPGTM